MTKINEKILIVDDDPQILAMYPVRFNKVVDIITAERASIALDLLKQEKFAVFVVDYNLPEMNGLELIKQAQIISPDTISLILTGEANLDLAISAINQGNIFKFLVKPCSYKVMAAAFIDALKEYRTIRAKISKHKQNYTGVVAGFIHIIKLLKPSFLSTRKNLELYISAISANLSPDTINDFQLSVLLAALNFDTISPEISQKIQEGTTLNKEEALIASNIPKAMEMLLQKIPMLSKAKELIRYSLKHFNGIGYPHDDLIEEAIPYEARIINILLEITRQEANSIDFLNITKNMRDEPNKYDIDILNKVEEWIKHAKYEQISATIINLRIGDLLLDNISTNKGIILVSSGNKVTKSMIIKLQNHPEVEDIIQPINVHRNK